MSERMSRCVVSTDGGARGNPGPAGAGWIVRTVDGEDVCRGGRFLGTATNNEAEYFGVLGGLRAARQAGFTAVELRSDSELVVRQMAGVYRVKSEGLRPLHAQAVREASVFAEVSYVHVAREMNCEADALVNAVIDSEEDIIGTPPCR